jgi:hypothetical protein
LWGQPRRRCTRGVAARRYDVRRGGSQWRTAVTTPASGNWPHGAVQTLAVITHSGTPGAAHGPLGPPLPRHARAARVRPLVWHACTTSRVGALWRSRQKQFAEAVFKWVFLQIFKLKCILGSEAKLKIRHYSTTFTKAGRGFVQEFEQERHANLPNFSTPVNSKQKPCFAIFTLLHSKPVMPLNSKVVCLNTLHIFPFGWF